LCTYVKPANALPNIQVNFGGQGGKRLRKSQQGKDRAVSGLIRPEPSYQPCQTDIISCVVYPAPV